MVGNSSEKAYNFFTLICKIFFKAFYLKPTFESNTSSNPLCVNELISFAMRLREKILKLPTEKAL